VVVNIRSIVATATDITDETEN